MKAHDQLLNEIRTRISEVSPREALALQADGAVVIDVREIDELKQGTVPGSLAVGRGFLELRIEELVPDRQRAVVAMCASGIRSLFVADSLARLGYAFVRSMAGGFNRWKIEGLPIEAYGVMDGAARERYSRHLRMPEVGEAGQEKLARSKVLIVGAGGLGSPAAFYLTAAGVGTIGLVDDDVVERSNLQRQILHTDARVGVSKVVSARLTLEALNPTVKVVCHDTRLTSENIEKILGGYDIVVDGADNFPTRYLVNDACVKLGLPHVHGAVMKFDGQVSVFGPSRPQDRGPCYRCLFPEPPAPDHAPSCAEAGVLGVLPGVIGVLQACETIKVLLGIGEPIVGRLLLYDALQSRFSALRFQRNLSCRYCGEGQAFPGYVDYEYFCANSVRT